MKSYDEIADEYANKRLIGARTKELMKNPLFKDVAELYAQQRVNEVLDKAAESVQMKVHDGHFKTDSYSKHVQVGANNIQIDKESILKLKNK